MKKERLLKILKLLKIEKFIKLAPQNEIALVLIHNKFQNDRPF